MQMLDDPLGQFLGHDAPFFYLVLDQGAVVRAANSFTSELIGRDPCGCPLAELFVNLQPAQSLAALVQEPARVHRLDVLAQANLPQTVLCRFQRRGDSVLVLGQVDMGAMQQLQRDFIGINNALNSATRALHKANAELERLNTLKNRFVGFAAHDLRKPVSVVQAYAGILLDEAADSMSHEHLQFLAIIEGRATAMARLINELLDIAVIEAGQHDLVLERTELAQIFQVACLSLEHAAQARQVRIAVALEPGLPPLRLDRSKIEQILVNLLSNAVEHTRQGSTVTLAARQTGASLLVAVADQGSGIAPDGLGQLFQPFARGQQPKPGGQASHGLGLSIARMMVHAHGGRIWAENAEGAGATFFFTLPMARVSVDAQHLETAT